MILPLLTEAGEKLTNLDVLDALFTALENSAGSFVLVTTLMLAPTMLVLWVDGVDAGPGDRAGAVWRADDPERGGRAGDDRHAPGGDGRDDGADRHLEGHVSRVGLALRAIVLPQFLHELAHAAAGDRWAAETRIDWSAPPTVTFRWDGARRWQVAVAQLAPTLVGLPVGALIVASSAAGMTPRLPVLVWLWIFASWVYFSTPSPDDIGGAVNVLRAGDPPGADGNTT